MENAYGLFWGCPKIVGVPYAQEGPTYGHEVRTYMYSKSVQSVQIIIFQIKIRTFLKLYSQNSDF